MADEDVNVVLTANTSPYERSIDSAAVATNRLLDVTVKLTTAIDGAFKAAGRTMTIGGASMVASVTAAGFAAGRLESQMEHLQATTEMVSKTQAQYQRRMDLYAKSITTMRSEFGLTSQQAISLASQLQKLGQATSNVEQLSRSFTQLAAVSGEGVGGLVDGMIQLQRALGNEGVRSTKLMNATLAELSQNAGASATGIVQFANSLAPVAKMSGISQREIMGISTAFVKSGQDGFAAANAFNKMLTDITRSIQYGSPEIANYANLIGVSVDAFKQMPKAEALTQIFEAINAQGPQALKTLERMGLDGVRSLKAIQGVAQTGGIRNAIYDAMGVQDDAKLGRSAEKAFDGLNDQLKKMAENGKMIAEAFGQGVLPAMTGVARAVNSILSPMRSMLQALKEIPGGAALLTGGALLAGGAIASAFTTMSTIGLATGAARTLGGGFRAGRGLPLNARQQAQYNSYVDRTYGLPATGNWFQHMLIGGTSRLGDMYERNRGGAPVGLSARFASGGRALAMGGINLLSNFVGAGLAPLSSQSWENNTNRDPRYQVFQSASARESLGLNRLQQARAGFGAALHGQDAAAARAAVAATQMAAGMNTAATTSRTYSGVMSQLVGETRTLAGAMLQATGTITKMAGIGAGRMIGAAAPGAWSAARGIGSTALSMVGGVPGVTFMGGLYAWDKYNQGKAATESMLQDNSNTSPLGVYQTALSEASAATRTFADVVKEQASRARAEGYQPTPTQWEKDTVANTPEQYTNPAVGTASKAELKSMAQVFYSGNPSDAAKQAFRMDLMRRFPNNMDAVEATMASGRSGRVDLSPMIQGTWNEGTNGLFGPTKEAIASSAGLGSSIQQLIASAGMGGGQEGANRAAQMSLATLNQMAVTSGKNRGIFGTMSEGGTQAAASAYVKGILGKEGKQEDIDAVAAAMMDAGGDPTKLRQRIAASGTSIGDYVEKQTRTVQAAGGDVNATQTPTTNWYRSSFVNAGVSRNQLAWLQGTGSPNASQNKAVNDLFANGTSPTARAMIDALSNEGDLNSQYNAGIKLSDQMIKTTGNFADAAAALDQIKAAAGSASSALYQQADAARGFVRQRQAEAMPYMTSAQRTRELRQNMEADRATNLLAPSEKTAEAAEQSRQAYVAQRASVYEQLKGFALQVREYNVMRDRAEEDYARQRQYNEDDYNRSRQYANDDFYKSRRRQEEDFNHQVVLMAQQTAKQMTNIYERLNVQRTWSAQNLMQNMADQQARLDEMQSNLAKLRKAGLSGTAIEQMGLNDPNNMQQLARLAEDLLNDPKMIAAFNAATKKRVSTGKAIATDKDNTQWKEMQRSFNLSMSRSLEDFNINLDRQAEQYQIGLDRMQEAYDRGMERSAEDLNRGMTEITGSFNELAKLALDTLTGTADQQMTALLGELGYVKGQVLGMSEDTIKEVNDLFQGLGLSPGGTLTKSNGGRLMTGTIIIDGKRYNAGMMAGGGEIPGYSPHKAADNVPIMATAGEYMQPVDAVRYYGKDFMDQIRDRRLPKYANGGMVYQQMEAWLKQNVPGAKITSDYRPGAITALGNTSMHAKGKAVDIAPSMATFNAILSAFGNKIYQLFYSPADGRTMLRGKPWRMDPVTKGDHWNHVHWAMQSMSGLMGAEGGGGGWAGDYEGLLKLVSALSMMKKFNTVMKTSDLTAFNQRGNKQLDKTVAMRGYLMSLAGNNEDAGKDPQIAGSFRNQTKWAGDGGLYNGAQVLGVGERGPEAVIPLNSKGVDFVFDLMKKNSHEAQRARVATSGMVTRGNTSNYYSRIDKSTIIKSVTVQSQNPDEMLRKIEAKKRMEALKGRH